MSRSAIHLSMKVSARVVKPRGRIIKAAHPAKERGAQLGHKLFKAVALFPALPFALLETMRRLSGRAVDYLMVNRRKLILGIGSTAACSVVPRTCTDD